MVVFYPVSRHASHLTGHLGTLPLPEADRTADVTDCVGVILTAPCDTQGQHMEAGSMVLIDPRCLVRDVDDGTLLYNPREHVNEMGPTFRTWMDAHPEWPPTGDPDKLMAYHWPQRRDHRTGAGR